MGPTLLLVGKVSLLLSGPLLVAPLLRRAPAAVRHRLWTTLFGALLVLPLLIIALPAFDVPLPFAGSVWTGLPSRSRPLADLSGRARAQAANDQATRGSSGAAPAGERRNANVRVEPSADRSGLEGTAIHVNARTALLVIWLLGSVIASLRLGISLLRVRRLARTARLLDETPWQAAAARIAMRLGLRRPVSLLVSAEVGTPMAGGLWGSAIFLPASARAWNPEMRDVVLAHEMVHLLWRDPLRHLVMRLALALYWFHPLAWIAAWQAAVAREQACDEAVVALGTRRSAYARVLLDLADTIHAPVIAAAALPMVQPGHLERRVMTILTRDVRPATRRLALIPVLCVMVLAVSVAAARPTQPAARANAMQPALASFAPAPPPTPHARVAAPEPGPAPSRLATAGVAPALQSTPSRASACDWTSAGASFSGSMSITRRGETDIREQVGRSGSDRIIQKTFGDLRVCMLAEDAVGGDRPSQLIGTARRVVLEARRGNTVQRLEVPSGAKPVWQVDGQARTFDAAAETWRDRMLALLDTTWEIATLRGRESSLRGEISSIEGERSSLQGEISSLRGEVSSMHGEISSVRGHESTLNGRISSIQGHLSSLQGEVSSERGAISSLNARRYEASDAERAKIATNITDHEARIKAIEQEIRDYDAAGRVAAVARERDAYDANGKVAAVEARIKAFDVESKVANVERRIKALDVEGKVAAIERQIRDLDADRRVSQLEDRQQGELSRVRQAIDAIR